MKKSFITISFLILFLFILIGYSCADTASSIGTVNNVGGSSNYSLTTTSLITTSHNYYLSLGYSPSYQTTDPSYITLLGNLMSEVQLFATHGAVDSISFKSGTTGIRTGSSQSIGGRDYIGVGEASSSWSSYTKLVTYMACNTAGTLRSF